MLVHARIDAAESLAHVELLDVSSPTASATDHATLAVVEGLAEKAALVRQLVHVLLEARLDLPRSATVARPCAHVTLARLVAVGS